MLEIFQLEFIQFAKIFLTDIIQKLNDHANFDKDCIYESFSKILTLSYLEPKNHNTKILDPLLQ